MGCFSLVSLKFGEVCFPKKDNFWFFLSLWKWIIISFGVSSLLVACRMSVVKEISYNENDHKAYILKGDSSIDGEGFLRRPNGFLARCSGNFVYLVPATPYFREWVQIRKDGKDVENAKDLYNKHSSSVRKEQCSMNGGFSFSNLPAGKWIVVTNITYSGKDWENDSMLVSEIETKKGEVVKVVLSNPNRI